MAIGKDYEGTKDLINKCKELINPSGQILLHYFSVIPTQNQDYLRYHDVNKSHGKRIGEITARIRYRTMTSSWFKLFLPTEEEFLELTEKTGLAIINKWKSSETSFYVQLAKNE